MPSASAAEAAVLNIAGLAKRYGEVAAVAGVDLEIRRGECFGLLGPNGAGKTTTLRLALGLTQPDAGEISLLGRPVPAQAREARSRVGVVPQVDSLDPDFSVRENLMVFGRYFGLSPQNVASRLAGLLEFAGLTQRADTKIATLSGGMKRRLALARALVNDPEFIVLDEPSTGLDPQARHLIWDRLKQLRAQGRTLLLTTHFMDEAERLCDRLAIIDRGRVIALGSPRELIARHIEPQVVEVYGDGLGDWLDGAAQLAERIERVGETAFCYCRDPAPLLESLQGLEGLRYLHRPANLEDLFLKMTGRELRD